LRNIEAATHAKLEIAHLPTVADLRERRSEILRANLREALLADGYDRFRGVVEPLTDEFDLVDIALAAVSLIEGAGSDAAEVEIASPPLVIGPPARPSRAMPPRRAGPPPRPGERRPPDGAWVRLFIGGGRRAGIRPGDLVGAITNEAGVPGSTVGAIQINEGFSLVDVQEGVADAVIRALREATIRGRRLQVRRDS
jgi:ATP-dependent RNA helicase DeaD